MKRVFLRFFEGKGIAKFNAELFLNEDLWEKNFLNFGSETRKGVLKSKKRPG